MRTIPLFSLIKSGATYSYVLSELACELRIPVEIINKGMTVTSSFGESILVNIVYGRCSLMIQEQVFFTNLMKLQFYRFDVILGMN